MDRKIDVEQLIATIKLQEAIWNKHKKEYHKKLCKEKAWNQVCEKLIPGWNDLNEEDRSSRQGELKKRWNNVRDYYKKDLALQMNGSIGQPTMKRSKYIFSKHLEFMRPMLEQSRSFYNEKTNICEKEEDETEEIYLEDNSSSDSETSHLLKRKSAIKLLEDSNLEDSKYSEDLPIVATGTRISELIEDSDLLFLKSLLPDMKMMSYSQKIDFKMGILKLYKNIMFKNSEDDFESEDSKNPLK